MLRPSQAFAAEECFVTPMLMLSNVRQKLYPLTGESRDAVGGAGSV